MNAQKNIVMYCFAAPPLILVLILLAGWSQPAAHPALDGSDLLGMSPAQVIERLGVPESVGCGPWYMGFWYPSQDGKAEAVVRFHEGCAFWVKPGFSMQFQPKPVPSKGAYPSQPIREMVKMIGQPESLIQGQNSLTLVYASGMEIDIGHGIVLDVDEK